MKMCKLRFISLLLACLLCCMAVPVTAFAGGGPEFEAAEDVLEGLSEESVSDETSESAEAAHGEANEESSGESPGTETSEPPTGEPAEPVADPEYQVQVEDVEGYYNEPVTLTIRIEDVGGTGWEKAEVSLDERDLEQRIDLTEALLEDGDTAYTVSGNCTVYFFITDLTGTEHQETYEVDFFDYEPPAVEAGIRNRLLTVEASDFRSGVAGIYVNGQLYTTMKNGQLELPIDGCTENPLFYIQAEDRLGNFSGYLILSNPYYKEKLEEPIEPEEPTEPEKTHDSHCPEDCDCRKQQTTTPPSTTGTGTTPATPAAPSTGSASSSGNSVSSGSASKDDSSGKKPDASEPVTKEPGEGFSEDGNGVTRDLLYDKYTNKQFITITDRDGNTFYMVIDYDSPINEDEEQYQTYFLNPVDTADLLALIGEDTAETLATCSCTEPCQPGAVNMNCEICAKDMTQCVCKATVHVPEQTENPAETEPEAEEPEETGGLNPVVLVLVLALVGGGGALAYFKLVKNKPKTKGNADLDDYDYGEEEDTEEDAPWESVEEDAADSENSEGDMD